VTWLVRCDPKDAGDRRSEIDPAAFPGWVPFSFCATGNVAVVLFVVVVAAVPTRHCFLV
jgi:hypothetical protein